MLGVYVSRNVVPGISAMDMVPLIDLIGEPGAALAGGAVLGLVFGVLAQRTGFCTRSAVLDLARGRDMKALAMWAGGFAAAVLGVQTLLFFGMIDVVETRFFATAQSLSGAAIGGLLFGIGMILARGCASRLLILGASGNLRAAFSVLVIGAVGLATYNGALVPLRDAIGGLVSTAAIGGNDLLFLAGLDRTGGLAIGVLLSLVALTLALVYRLSVWRLIGSIGVGCTIAAGWYFTYTLSAQVFDPIQVESLSFIRPLATSVEAARDSSLAGLDQGLLAGVVAGGLLSALLFRDFRVVTFSEPGAPSILRYALGSALMGFGGILAVGCTIGAGFSGGSVLAVSSLLGLCAMIAGAWAADRLLDRDAAAHGASTAALAAE
jgi:uncharacterized membrane protein YedE/YeeE